MKKSLILGSLAALTLTVSAQAQTVVDITGATAFRQGATATINAIFVAGGNFVSIQNGGLNGGNLQAWRGNFGNLTNLTIRTRWNGSTEGLRAVFQPNQTIDSLPTNPQFFVTTALDAFAPVAGGGANAVSTSGNTVADVAELAFSDVRKEATPIPGASAGGAVGVVTFTMVANKTWRDDPRTANITNVTSQQFRTLFTQGSTPLSYFTGNLADTDLVYASGRNDGSGTRTTYLAETGFGANQPVQQYVGYDRSNTTVLPSILLVPRDGGFGINTTGVLQATPTNRSTLWSQNVNGNGGYVSGGDLRVDFRKTTANTSVLAVDDQGQNITNNDIQELVPAGKLFLLSWLSTADAAFASQGNTLAVILGYDGVRLDDLAALGNATNSTLTIADRTKVTTGRYAAWSNQQLLYSPGNATVATVFNFISGNVSANIGSAGIPSTEMTGNGTSRTADGGIISKF